MAGVYLKGMKMPERGLVEIIIAPDGTCYELERPLIDTENAKVTEYYNAIGVPDHGGLIERSEIEKLRFALCDFACEHFDRRRHYSPGRFEFLYCQDCNIYRAFLVVEGDVIIPGDKEEV